MTLEFIPFTAANIGFCAMAIRTKKSSTEYRSAAYRAGTAFFEYYLYKVILTSGGDSAPGFS